MPTPDEQRTADQQRRRDELLALLLGLAAISEGDIDAARTLWEQHAPKAYAGLIDGSDRYAFDPATQLYVRQSTGRTVPAREIKRVSLAFASGIARDVIEPDAAKVAQGGMDIDQWAERMAQDLKDTAIVMAALAAGGFDYLDNALRARVVGNTNTPPGLAFSLDRLYQFALGIKVSRGETIPLPDETERPKPETDEAPDETPEPGPAPEPMSEQRIIDRASLYPASTNGLFEDIKRESHKNAKDDNGRLRFLYERNVFGDSITHCIDGKFTEGCTEATEAGWQPIGSLSLPGQRSCGPRCACEMAYSLVGGAAEEN